MCMGTNQAGEGVEAEVGCRDILASFMSLLAH